MKKILVLFAAGIAFLPLTAAAQAQVLVKDAFQEADNPDNPQNKEITGIKPSPIDFPGAAWQLAAGDGTYEAYLTPPAFTNAACFHNVASVALNVASAGPYVKPPVLILSAELTFATDTPTAICLLGFYSALSGPHTGNILAHFTGLALHKNGSLQLIENGVAAGPIIPYTGKYDSSKSVTLSYTIDTARGAISNVSLSGSTSAYAFTSKAFTNAATTFLGIGGQTDGQSICYFNNLQLSSGPNAPASTPAPAKAR